MSLQIDDYSGLPGQAPRFVTCVLTRERQREIVPTEEEAAVWPRAETGVMWPRTKECQQSAQVGGGKSFPSHLWSKCSPANTLLGFGPGTLIWNFWSQN